MILFILLFFCSAPALGYRDDLLKYRDAVLFLTHPKCEICEEKLAIWKSIQKQHKEKNIILDYVDCDKHVEFCTKQNIDQYPTILFNVGKEWTKFLQSHSEQNINKFIETFPKACRFPNNLEGCHSEVIEWTHNTKSHTTFDYKKELDLINKKIIKKIKEIQIIVEDKQIIAQKSMFLDYLNSGNNEL